MNAIRLICLLTALLLQGCASGFDWFSDDDEKAKAKTDQLERENQAREELKLKRDAAEREVDPDNEMKLQQEATPINNTRRNVQPGGQEAIAESMAPSSTDGETSEKMASRVGDKQSTNTQAGDFQRQFAHLAQADIRASKQKQIQSSVENDYEVFRALNHDFIKNYTAPKQYKALERTISHFVMDLIGNMNPELHRSPMVVRPMKLKVRNVANASGGKELITALIAAQMQDYGFIVFDGRKPKGKFMGDELILETHIESYGEQFVLYGTLRQLSSNKVAGTHQTFISDYFFRNIQDGVEVY